MDKQTAEVITMAIEQQKQHEKALAEQQARERHEVNNENNKDDTDSMPAQEQIQLQRLAQQQQDQGDNSNNEIFELENVSKESVRLNHGQGTDSKSAINTLPRSAAHKAFAVDPSLNVGMGIVTGIIGPKIHHPDYIGAHANAQLDKSECTRCKKAFALEPTGRVFKLCPNCRELQRQRSRRWQQKTKLKEGACRRCAVTIPAEESNYVLCPPCRLSLRSKKARRYENGKCVHCSGVNDSPQFKVCTRCRDNDKARRIRLEESGCCNRCANPLQEGDHGHKVCLGCRSRKKRFGKTEMAADQASPAPQSLQAVQVVQRAEAVQNLQNQVAANDAAAAAEVSDSNETYQQQVARQLEANLFAQSQAQRAQQQTSS